LNVLLLKAWTKVFRKNCTFGAFARTQDAITTSPAYLSEQSELFCFGVALPEQGRDKKLNHIWRLVSYAN